MGARWPQDRRRLLFYRHDVNKDFVAGSNDASGTSDLFAVAVAGPEPGPPIKLDDGVAGGDTFIFPYYGPDDSRVYYPRMLDPTPETFVAGSTSASSTSPARSWSSPIPRMTRSTPRRRAMPTRSTRGTTATSRWPPPAPA